MKKLIKRIFINERAYRVKLNKIHIWGSEADIKSKLAKARELRDNGFADYVTRVDLPTPVNQGDIDEALKENAKPDLRVATSSKSLNPTTATSY